MQYLDMFRTLEIEDYDKGFLNALSALGRLIVMSRERFIEFYKCRAMQGVITLVGEIEGEVVCTGSYFVETKFIHNGSKVMHIEDVAVKHELQGKGYGKAIMDRLEYLAKLQGCYKIILNCNEENIPFYERCGFIRHEIEMRKNLTP